MNDLTPIRRKTAADFPQELLDLYDYYAHGRITKREFLDRAAKFAIGGVTAAALLDQLVPDYALAQQVAPDDPAIEVSKITYDSPDGNGQVDGYLVRNGRLSLGAEAPGPFFAFSLPYSSCNG